MTTDEGSTHISLTPKSISRVRIMCNFVDIYQFTVNRFILYLKVMLYLFNYCSFLFHTMMVCKYQPFWQEVNVEIFILKWLLGTGTFYFSFKKFIKTCSFNTFLIFHIIRFKLLISRSIIHLNWKVNFICIKLCTNFNLNFLKGNKERWIYKSFI